MADIPVPRPSELQQTLWDRKPLLNGCLGNRFGGFVYITVHFHLPIAHYLYSSFTQSIQPQSILPHPLNPLLRKRRKHAIVLARPYGLIRHRIGLSSREAPTLRERILRSFPGE